MQQRPSGGAPGQVLQRKAGTFSGFFSNIGLAIADLFTGSEPGFGEAALKRYLKTISDANDIEDDFDSDNKARAVVRKWKSADREFNLSAIQKALLIREMQSGYVGSDDQHGIIDLLENSDAADLRVIFTTGRVTAKSLEPDFGGDRLTRLRSFFVGRFKGGRDALLKGIVDPQGASANQRPLLPV